MQQAFIAIGSNVDDRLEHMKKAVSLLAENSNIKLINCSSVYETEPLGEIQQQSFFNAVCEIETSLAPLDLLKQLKDFESEIGRKKTVQWGPREIDFDILFYNGLIFNSDHLIIPHKEILNRGFVLIPLMEIAANFIHPALNKKVKELVTSHHQKEIIKKLAEKLI